MVQKKYFGDKHDYFKYDLLTSVIKEVPFREYVFIPMLTREKNNYPIGSKCPKLYRFINEHRVNKGYSLKHWQKWLTPYIDNYHTVEPVDSTYFCPFGEKRNDYWNKFKAWFCLENALIFLDPDTGLEPGKPYDRDKRGPEKYLRNDELKYLLNSLDKTSAIMIYQQLQRNSNLRAQMLKKKLNQISKKCCSDIFLCAYTEDDLAFIFVSKQENIHIKLANVLNKYYTESDNRFRFPPHILPPL